MRTLEEMNAESRKLREAVSRLSENMKRTSLERLKTLWAKDLVTKTYSSSFAMPEGQYHFFWSSRHNTIEEIESRVNPSFCFVTPPRGNGRKVRFARKELLK